MKDSTKKITKASPKIDWKKVEKDLIETQDLWLSLIHI